MIVLENRSCTRERRAGSARRPLTSLRSEDLGCTRQRLPHPPGERYADESPEQRSLRIETALADTERAILGCSLLLGARGLQFRNLLATHVPFRIDRLDQVVADEARD